MYARLGERILGIPCTGLGLCHIQSPFILNNYGQPLRDKDGYHVDPNGVETVKWFRIEYLANEAEAVFKDRLLQLRAIEAKQDKQLKLFND